MRNLKHRLCKSLIWQQMLKQLPCNIVVNQVCLFDFFFVRCFMKSFSHDDDGLKGQMWWRNLWPGLQHNQPWAFDWPLGMLLLLQPIVLQKQSVSGNRRHRSVVILEIPQSVINEDPSSPFVLLCKCKVNCRSQRRAVRHTIIQLNVPSST